MSQIEINKQRFKDLLPQFIGDAPFEIDLIRTLLDQLPDNARDYFITEYFYEKLYTGPLIILQHCIYKDDIRYFQDMKDAVSFLKEHCLSKDDAFRIDSGLVKRNAKLGQPIFGYLITLKEVNNG